MAVWFHRITLFALPVNLLILPLLLVLMPAALLTCLLLFIWPKIATLSAMLAAVLLHVGAGMVRIFGSLRWGDVRLAEPTWWQAGLFWGLLGAAIAAMRIPGRRFRVAAWCALLLAGVAVVVPLPVRHPHDALFVEAIDVGQGDSILLITPEGRTLLVDGGGIGGGPRQAAQEFDIGEEVVSAACGSAASVIWMQWLSPMRILTTWAVCLRCCATSILRNSGLATILPSHRTWHCSTRPKALT